MEGKTMKKKSGLFMAAVLFLAAAGTIPAQPVMSVKITSPASGSRFAKCSDLLITVDPQIQGGEIKNVALLRNNAGVTARIKAPWEFKLSNYPSGFYVFQARLTAKTNEVVYSDPVTVYVGDGLKGNVLMNGEFECSSAPWTLNVQGGASATFTIDTSAWISNGAAAVIAIGNGGTADWHIQLQQTFPVDSGHTYIVYFTAQTDQNSMPISAMIQQNKDPWAVYSSGVSATVEALQEYGPFTFESVVTDHEAFLRFNLGNFPNSIVWLDAIQIYDMSLTGLKDRKPLDAGEVPDRCLISRNYPNPFNPRTTIEYRLPDEADVTLTLYNAKGQVVRTLVRENQKPGEHLTSWNGENENGQRVPSGVYVYRLEAKAPDMTYSLSRKIMMLE
jgi:hypothetical protein